MFWLQISNLILVNQNYLTTNSYITITARFAQNLSIPTEMVMEIPKLSEILEVLILKLLQFAMETPFLP